MSDSFLALLEQRRAGVNAEAKRLLSASKRAGRTTLSRSEQRQFDCLTTDLEHLNQRIADTKDDMRKATGGENSVLRKINSRFKQQQANVLAPLSFSEHSLRDLHKRVLAGGVHQLQMPSFDKRNTFSSPDSVLPSQLFPLPLFPIHEHRILNYLPSFATEAPSVEYVQVTGVTGSAAIVAEGGQKPEVSYATAKVVANVDKIACHSAVSWEIIEDWHTFYDYVQADIMRMVIDAENAAFLNGSSGIVGFQQTSGVLTLDVSTVTGTGVTAIDALEHARTMLRVGSSLAEADLVIMHPNSWSAISRLKSTDGRFLLWSLNETPANVEKDAIFGIPVLTTTAITAGTAVMLDSSKFGRGIVREPIRIRLGYDGADFTHNLLRSIAEERLTLAVERPTAVLTLTNLPVT